MKIKSIIYIVSSLFSIFVFCGNIYAWNNNKTHPDISNIAVDHSVLNGNASNYLINIGIEKGLEEAFTWSEFTKTARKWLQEGAKLEDGSFRELNHFHNPLQPWSSAGLHIAGIIPFGESAVLWSQDSSLQAVWSNASKIDLPYPGIVTMQDSTTPTDWSWQTTRNYFYDALIAQTKTDRESYFAKTFFGLGHQMHLLQDMSVPMHVRNNQHLTNPMIEGWVATHESDAINEIASVPIPTVSLSDAINDKAPVARLFDTDLYIGFTGIAMSDTSYGLAEWTNANFFSDDTINLPSEYVESTAFPYPNYGDTNLIDYLAQQAVPKIVKAPDGVLDTGMWVQKINANNEIDIIHFAKFGYTTIPLAQITGDPKSLGQTFILDDECYHDYAEKLLPRAVGYSAALLNYFFRGTLDVSWPATGVYSIADGSKSPQQFTTIKAAVLNTSTYDNVTYEDMGPGTLTAVARYKIIPNYAPDLSNYPPDGTAMGAVPYTYSVSAQKALSDEEVTGINNDYTDITFDFSNSPIPAGITDLTLQVVFKGTIGNEADNAIAVGMRDLKEPSHFTVWNLTDMFPLPYSSSTYTLYTFDQIKALAQPGTSLLQKLDLTGDGTVDDEPYLKPVTSTYTISFWNGFTTSPTVTVDIPAGKHIRFIALTDQTEIYTDVVWNDSVDPGSMALLLPGVDNQADSTGYYPPPTDTYPFRSVIAADGQVVPSKQHYYFGTVECKAEDMDAYGDCPYPYETANPVTSTPIPFTSVFDQTP